MTDNNIMSRRRFLGTGIAAAAAFTIVPRHVLGGVGFMAPSDQITLGFIGTGKQARGLIGSFANKAKIIAGCDVDARKLENFQTLTRQRYERQGTSNHVIKTYRDFRELLSNKEIDATVISTPDHWHAIQVIESAKAGKDIMCEKPFAHDINQGRLMVQAVEKYEKVLQVGSQQRSNRNFRNACRLVRNGLIGDVIEVKVSCGPPPKKFDLPAETKPDYLDWEMWVGPAEFNHFNAELSPPLERDIFPNWRNYKEYGNGMTADWGTHMFDIAQWGLGTDHTGPVAVYPPGADHRQLTFVYENGIKMTHEDFGRGYGVRFIGTRGVVDISREYFETLPGNLARREFTENDIKLYESDDHYQDWIDCIRARKQPICTAEIGHRTATICFITNICYELRRPLRWDPVKEEFLNDAEANRMRAGYLRAPWSMTV